MSTILHTSDLHFSGKSREDMEYSTFVWKTILDLAIARLVDAILLSGDIFDTYEDLEKYRKDFLACIPEGSPAIYAITGNHEYLQKPNRSEFASLDLSPILWFHEPGFTLVTSMSDWELAVLPYNPTFSQYRDWKIPPKSKPRILMAHGMVPEAMVYTGPSEEEGDHILELDLIRRFDPDYVALGHIHKKTHVPGQGFPIHYCGSPQVWRRGESGKRSVNLVRIQPNAGVIVDSIELREVGMNREISSIQVSPSGQIPTKQLSALLEEDHCPQDSVHIIFMGFVDSEPVFKEEWERVKREFQPRFRNFTSNTDQMNYMTGISELPIVKNFLRHWEKKFLDATTDQERGILEEARQIGLEAISNKYKGIRG